ncbi:hypothetical protein [Nocardia sp. NPDC004722]
MTVFDMPVFTTPCSRLEPRDQRQYSALGCRRPGLRHTDAACGCPGLRLSVDNRAVGYFGIQGYQPHWLAGRDAIESTHGRRLAGLVGSRLSAGWLVWNRETNAWFPDGPVLLDFDGEQVEIVHQKFDELSITWNGIDPIRFPVWPNDDDNPEAYGFQLAWRRDAVPALFAFEGQVLTAVDLLEYAGHPGDFAAGMVAVSFAFDDRRVTISNGLDENRLEFGGPSADYRRHQLHA